ncbi:hypothetical protein [Paenibacillus wynnii]|uniref:hypothetical protein n=1 Tax=Paenibacillus wynnii TaxID=268407 RepID=UPI0027934207|nr:hypothetical protein [Paenibacillus wynnii]MDQ0195368.1 hypothetical protein [Paenibacillus wynnii]
MKNIILKKRSMKTILLLLFLLILTSFFFFNTMIKTAFQEGNPVNITSSILKLNFSDNELVEISGISIGSKYISKFKDGSTPIINFMKKNGEWEFKEQVGSGYVFEYNKKTITVESNMYSKKYIVWNVPQL